jgi:hypothetical protein
MAWCWGRPPAFGPSGRATAGFWGVCRCAHDEQNGRKGPTNAIWGERMLSPQAFPGQALLLDGGGRQPELGIGGQCQ